MTEPRRDWFAPDEEVTIVNKGHLLKIFADLTNFAAQDNVAELLLKVGMTGQPGEYGLTCYVHTRTAELSADLPVHWEQGQPAPQPGRGTQ